MSQKKYPNVQLTTKENKMSYSQELKNSKVRFTPHVLVAGSTGEIDLAGGTLTGILLIADITSTTFTITVSNISGGTFATVKDPLSSGNAITYTVGSTATGYFPINPINTQGFRFCKIVFDQSETPTIYVGKRSFQ